MYQKNKNKSNSNILENIKTILKLLIYFDTYSLVQKNSSDTKNHKKIYKGGSINSELDEIENEEEDQAEGALDQLGLGFLDEIIIYIKNAVGEAFKSIKLNTINLLVIPILFASVAPAMPFLLVMSIMAAILKFFMWHFRKL
jgi:hypothetical protein